METLMNFFSIVSDKVGSLFQTISDFISADYALNLMYTAAARWVFIFLGLFIVIKSIISLLRSKKSFGSMGISSSGNR